ncbi:MAG: inositol monophosphatase [Proteobacteria bacterium]|nr:inositol monophosphatase [Pseudomonadota bacterium]
MSSSPVLTVMINAVRKAARGVQRDYGEVSSLQVSMKGPGDFVTASDKKAEKVLRAELAKARPTYGFLGEEEGLTKGEDPDHRFIIDPIDGTSNFMHALPFFAVTIALERKGEVVAGVTYNPISDELFHSEKGQGAFLNNKRMRVSARKNLHEALISTNIPNIGQKNQVSHRNEIAVLQARTAGIRGLGSAALELAYVACGRLDAAWCHHLNAWDMAAGLLFIREAGGFVSRLDGEGDPLHTDGYVASNAELMPQMKQALADAKKL